MIRSPLPLMQRLARDEEGASLVELAMVIMPFLLIVIASLDFGYRAYVAVVADSVAYRVAREATSGEITPNEIEAEVRRLIEPMLISDAVMTVETRSYFDFTSVGRPEQLTVDNNNDGALDETDCFIDENDNADFDTEIGQGGLGGADDVVVYNIDIQSPNLTGISELLDHGSGGFKVSATATGRNQPFATQDEPELQEYCLVGGIIEEV